MDAYRNGNRQNGRCPGNYANSNCGCRQQNFQNDCMKSQMQGLADAYEDERHMMYDENGRSMEVECVCSAKKNCHQKDAMRKLGDEFPTVMAYVPWQQWGDLYSPDRGLKEGTIFKELNKIFCGVRC